MVSLEKIDVEVALVERLKTAISEIEAYTNLPAGKYEMREELERLQSEAMALEPCVLLPKR